MKRTQARELAFQTIYSKFFNPDKSFLEVQDSATETDIDMAAEEDFLSAPDTAELAFTTEILRNFAAHYQEINALIEQHLKGYTIGRLNRVDLAIIVEAIIELQYIKENPKEVVINEAVNLAKKYSTEKSPKFVNGFLAEIANQ